MSEEKNVEKKECDCLCKNENFKKFVVVATGSFVGVFCALSLFAALHKPPMPCPCHRFKHPMPMYNQFAPRGDFRGMNKKFHKDFKGEMNEKDIQKPETNN